ncbi:FadR/GntR family transcriptional regulator [Gracilibacillus dipsosauri]|uniref:FadR/GntR family transcriptional regulator n=1 Tax=Gracilibacillus dipsosauri TaxID=178340 RepID=UPI00240A8E0C
MKIEPIQSTERFSLKKMVIQEIKNYIIENELSSGDKLPAERRLTEMFQVSRSVVREALSYLENTGVITTTQGKGAYLNESNMDTLLDSFFFLWQINGGKIEDMMSLRIMFESSAIEEIVKQVDMEEMETIQTLLIESKTAHTMEEYRKFDMLFHKQLLKATKNPLFIQMTNMINSYFFETEYIQLSPEEYQQVIREHQSIIEAIQNKDPELAKKLLNNHIKRAKL